MPTEEGWKELKRVTPNYNGNSLLAKAPGRSAPLKKEVDVLKSPSVDKLPRVWSDIHPRGVGQY